MSGHPDHYYNNQDGRSQQYSQSPYSPPPPPAHTAGNRNSWGNHPGAHPNSSFASLQAQRQGYGVPQGNRPATASPTRRPVPPQHNYSSHDRDVYSAHDTHGLPRRESATTPGVDHLGERAVGGGINGIAYGVANTHERESGVQALQDIDNWGRPSGQNGVAAPRRPPERDPYYNPDHEPHAYGGERTMLHQQHSYSSNTPLAAAAIGPGMAGNHSDSNLSRPNSYYGMPTDGPYNRYSHSRLTPDMATFDPMDIADDGDDGLTPAGANQAQRRSLLGLGGRTGSRNQSREAIPPTAAAAGATGGVGAASALNQNGQYNAVPGSATNFDGNVNPTGAAAEKSEWLEKQNSGNKKLKWMVGVLVTLAVLAVIAGAVVGGILGSKKARESHGLSADEDTAKNGDLSKNSKDIKSLMGNKNLHKVFPGMDYTPMNAQYPDCIHNPTSQNNVTRDMAVLSQLTNEIRLYGTDCNQTQMVLHALDRLQLKDTKVWLGVYLDNNDTTNARQISQMWDILDKYGGDPFKGLIIGNEVLFRKDLTAIELAKVLADVKTNMTGKGINLPIATSDLGDNWTADLASEVDIVMANIHPFFAGVTADKAAGWTYDFWQGHDVIVTKGMTGKSHVISEVGWPTGGGHRCGQGEPCSKPTDGSVAGIDQLNTFMDDFVCQALNNGTQFFWFEAIDEPWKVRYNKGNENWEDKWGLMTADRQLKDGVKIPSCGGKTVS